MGHLKERGREMFALNIDKETGRVLSATYPQYATDDAPIVEALPEGNISDYLYVNGEYVHEPIPKEEEPEAPTEMEQLRADIDYIAIMMGVDL